MFEKISKMKNKKGFTLVELIVVLVILAILAALLVPALTGYIDKANKEKVVSECRMVVMAAQTEASELYGKMNGGVLAFDTTNNTATKYDAAVKSLSETKGDFKIELYNNGSVHTVQYWNSVGLLLTLMALMARLPRRLLLALIPTQRFPLSLATLAKAIDRVF